MPVMGNIKKDKTHDDILKELLNPLQANALKTVTKIQKDQITEAMQQGVPPEDILKKVGVEVQTPAVQMGKMENTKEVAPTPQPTQQDAMAMLQKLLPSKGPFSSAQQTPQGIQQSGPFTFGTRTEDLIKNLVDMAKIQKSSQRTDLTGMSQQIQEANKKAPEGYQADVNAEGNLYYKPKPMGINELAVGIKEEQQQDRLEKNYRDLWTKGISRYSGGLGLQDAKVNQAIDLRTLMNQYYDPATGDFLVPPAQHTELALGLARLLSPSGVVAQELVQKLQQGTLREKLANTLIYFGKDPSKVGGSTQSVIKMFRDSIDRQGSTAERLRNKYYGDIKKLKPSRLSADRADAIDKEGSMGSSFDELLSQSPDKQTQQPKKSSFKVIGVR